MGFFFFGALLSKGDAQALRKNLLVPSLFGVTLQLHAGILTRALRLKAASPSIVLVVNVLSALSKV